jgi:hypothetical protein
VINSLLFGSGAFVPAPVEFKDLRCQAFAMTKRNRKVSSSEFECSMRRLHIPHSLLGQIIRFVRDNHDLGRFVSEGDGRTLRAIQWKKFQIHYTVNWATDAIQLIDIKPDPNPPPKTIFTIGKLAQRVAGAGVLIQAVVKIVRRWMDLLLDPSKSGAFMQAGMANHHPGLRAAQAAAHSTTYVP